MKNKLWFLVLLLALTGCNLNADDENPTPETIPTQAELPLPATFQVTNTPPPIQLTDRPSVGVTIVPDIRASSTPEPTSNAQPFPVYDSTSTVQPTAEIPSTYKDRYETQVTANVTLIVDYNVTFNRTGQYVTLWVRDPNGTILGSKTVTQTEAASMEVQTQVSGTHEILVYFDRLDGGYQVSFRTR